MEIVHPDVPEPTRFAPATFASKADLAQDLPGRYICGENSRIQPAQVQRVEGPSNQAPDGFRGVPSIPLPFRERISHLGGTIPELHIEQDSRTHEGRTVPGPNDESVHRTGPRPLTRPRNEIGSGFDSARVRKKSIHARVMEHPFEVGCVSPAG